jgi:hypothetical protein
MPNEGGTAQASGLTSRRPSIALGGRRRERLLVVQAPLCSSKVEFLSVHLTNGGLRLVAVGQIPSLERPL